MDDRGQKSGPHSWAVAIIVTALVVYLVGVNAVERTAIIPAVDPLPLLLYGLIAAAAVVALLAAYGAWLIGRGSDAEMQARSMASQRTVDRLAAEMEQSGRGGFRDRPEAAGNSTVMSTGWAMLDGLRTGDIPIVSWIEAKLGRGDDDD